MPTPAHVPPARPVTLRHLAQLLATRGEGPIRARFPGAALVVGGGGANEMRINTPVQGYPRPGPTPAPNADETCADWSPLRSAAAAAAATLTPVDPDQEVLPVVKSDRNPFAGIITVGRAQNNDVILGSVQVSKVHAFIRQRGDEWIISDNSSKNGTLLRGQRLVAKAERPLAPGDELQFADLRCRFVTADGLLDLCDSIDG